MIGQKLADRYEMLSELGRGGMGVVYRARDPVLNREVAIKVIAPSLLTPETEQRFQNEAQVVAQLDHPAIVSIHDFGRHEGSLFFVMPIIEGTSLRQFIRDQSLRLGEILEVGIGVAEALDYSESRGIVHRDIKPENVMVSRESGSVRVRVMDFGLARASEVSRITRTGMMVGTMSYTSPEQIAGRNVDVRSDIYSLATVLYECLCGEVPFSGDAQSVLYRIIHEIPQSLRERGADIDPKLDEIILGCLAKDPDKRPRHAADVVKALRGYRNMLRDSERHKTVAVSRIMPASRPALAPFVGRDAEMKELQQRLNAALAGECQFALVSGEEGVGKTRLLEELENLARARQVRVLHGHFVEQDGAFPYHGFCEAIQEYFRQKELGTSSSSGLPDFSDLGGELVSIFPMLSEIPAIRTTSGVQLREGGATARAPEDRTLVFELLARTLTRLAGGKPLILLFEDLHGAEVSIEALQYVVRRLGPTPTLIVGTFRSTEIDRRHPLTQMLAAFRGDRRFVRIDLEPFEKEDYPAFLATLIGDAKFRDDVAERLYEATKGNPFFTKELVRSLLDAGSIVRDEGGAWSFAGSGELPSDVLPATIQQAVEERLTRLPDDLRDILSVAAVMGMSFDFGDLESLAADEGDLDDAVERMIRAGLIEEERQSRGDTLAFTSGVIREVLYAGLSRRKRRSIHRKYAARLEKRHADRLERVYPQLVYHCAEGDLPDKTVEYALAHARRSLEAFSPEDAVRSVTSALDFLDEEWEGDPSIEADARMLLASAHQMHGDTDSALKEIAAAIELFDRHKKKDRSVEALLLAARSAWQARRPAEATQWVDRGIQAARAVADAESEAQFLSLAARLANLRGEYDKAQEYLKEAEHLGVAPRDEVSAAEEIPEGGRLVVALANPVSATEPATMETVEEWEVYSNAIETLVTTDTQGNLVAALADTWTMSEGGRAFVFKLRGAARFQDGERVTAQDVKRAFEHGIRASARHPVPALSPIRGVTTFLDKKADEVEGIRVRDESTLEIHLEEPLPIYPALLTDERAGVYKLGQAAGESRQLIGSGPFRLTSMDGKRVVLERSVDYWGGPAPRLEAIEFRHGMSATTIAGGLRSGDIDVGGDLVPADLEEILRDPRFRNGLAQAPKSTTYFAIFNSVSGRLAGHPEVRRALALAVRPEDLVWRSVGRFAQPAVGLLPPGMLGHDPGKRRPTLAPQQARGSIEAAGLSLPLELNAAVHPLLQDRYSDLLEALFSVWSELGVKVKIRTPDMASFMAAYDDAGDIDVRMMRWVADYNDPDNFTHNLFHSHAGQLRHYYCAAEADTILESARAETGPAERAELYRKFEDQLLGSGVLVPLFHDVEYRVAGPRVRGMKVRSQYPAVNYAELGKLQTEGVESAAGLSTAAGTISGIVRIPMSGQVSQLDPTLADSVEEGETMAVIYEGLTRTHDERIEPWLASSLQVADGGRSYRFRLRPEVAFHDGRRVTARDVRYSFERLLQNTQSMQRWHYDVIRGAKDLLEGKSRDLAGFHIHSGHEFSIELERPLVFFPVLLSFQAAAIVPEGTRKIGNDRKAGAVGTGPFRVVRFEPGKTLVLERHPDYWRPGYPRSEGLEFRFGVPSPEILAGFRGGRFSLAADLYPEDVETLRRDANYAAGYREAPSLSTYYAAFNVKRGPLADRELRRTLARGIDVGRLVRQTLGRRAMPAQSWIPPGLIGYEPGRKAPAPSAGSATLPDIELSIGVHPVFTSEYEAFLDALLESLQAVGVRLEVKRCETAMELIEGNRQGAWDLSLGRWYADYADTDTFAHVLHSEEGDVGRLCGITEVDELVRKGRSESNPRARHALYRELDENISREAILIPLFHEQVYRFAHPGVTGLTVGYGSPTVAYETLSLRSE